MSSVSISTCVNGVSSNVVFFIFSKNELLLFNALFSASNLDGLSACSKVLSQTGNTIFFKSSNLESKTSASAPKPSSSNQFDILNKF